MPSQLQSPATAETAVSVHTPPDSHPSLVVVVVVVVVWPGDPACRLRTCPSLSRLAGGKEDEQMGASRWAEGEGTGCPGAGLPPGRCTAASRPGHQPHSGPQARTLA